MVANSRLRVCFGMCLVMMIGTILWHMRADQSGGYTEDCVYDAGRHWIKIMSKEGLFHQNIRVYNPAMDSNTDRLSLKKHKCVALKTMDRTTPACIYDPAIDKYISNSILHDGFWEYDLVRIVGNSLRKHPEMDYLDLGCNIGAFTLMVAVEGRRIVAVDPNRMNLRLLAKSLCLGKLHSNVILINNAVSDVQGDVILLDDHNNVGGASALHVDNVASSVDDNHRALSITLDDLQVFFRGSSSTVFIKMDVQSFEYKVLNGGKNFMANINVLYILMEWIEHIGKETSSQIIKYMLDHDFSPYSCPDTGVLLDVNNTSTWPDNVLWAKNNI